MNLFISEAWAQAAAPAAPSNGGLVGFLPIIIIFVLFYFLILRPQTKRAKEHKAMVEALAKGDEVVTSGGIIGRVTELGEGVVTVEIAPGVGVKLQRQAVQTVLPKGTLKA